MRSPGFSLHFISGTIGQNEAEEPENRERYKAMLVENHQKGVPVYCGCESNHSDKLKFSVVAGESYFLRRYPGTAKLHHDDCQYAIESRTLGTASGTIPGLTRNEDGSLKLALSSSMFPLRAEGRAHRVRLTNEAPLEMSLDRQSKGSIGPRGLLHLLLDQAGIGQWRASFLGRRTIPNMFHRMRSVAQSISFGRGTPLNDAILWPTGPIDERYLWERIHQSPVRGARDSYEILVVAQMVAVHPSKSGKNMLLWFDWHRTPYLCEPTLWEEIERQHTAAFARDETGRLHDVTIVLATLRIVHSGSQGNERTFYFVKALGAAMLSKHLVPIESPSEATAVDALVETGRDFEKTIRHTPLDDELPNFVLTDTFPHTYCEVWSRKDPDYLELRRSKAEYCLREIKPLWQWDSVSGETMPPFPRKLGPVNRPERVASPLET